MVSIHRGLYLIFALACAIDVTIALVVRKHYNDLDSKDLSSYSRSDEPPNFSDHGNPTLSRSYDYALAIRATRPSITQPQYPSRPNPESLKKYYEEMIQWVNGQCARAEASYKSARFALYGLKKTNPALKGMSPAEAKAAMAAHRPMKSNDQKYASTKAEMQRALDMMEHWKAEKEDYARLMHSTDATVTSASTTAATTLLSLPTHTPTA
ncbi:hypothetical protein BT96DRAFT_924269, partial [Gymnopus androsaceus JB14]